MQYNLAKLKPTEIAALDKLPVRNQDAIIAKFGEPFVPSKAFFLLRDATANFTKSASGDLAYQLDAKLYEWAQKAAQPKPIETTPITEVEKAFELGRQAFLEGKSRVPARSVSMANLIAGKENGESLPIINAFLEGWDKANLQANPVQKFLQDHVIVGRVPQQSKAKPFSWNNYPLSQKFMPRHQQKAVQGFQEEREAILAGVEAMLSKIPGPYSQEKNEDPTVWAHYFYGQSDWYITEYHPDDSVFFGFTILNGDSQYAELGYISVSELVDSNRVELDFYWKPMPLSEAKFDADPGYFPDPNAKAPVTTQSIKEAIESLQTALMFTDDTTTQKNLREAIEALQTALEFA